MAVSDKAPLQEVGAGVRSGVENGAEFYRDNLNAIMASNHAMIRGYQAVSAEALAFLQSRLKETLEAGQRLAACRRPEDAFETQVEFMRASFEAYADEFKRMAEVSGRVFGESLAPLASRTGEVEKTVSQAA